MFRKRLIVSIFMVPIVIGVAVMGDIVFTLAITLVMGLAAWEFWRMFKNGGYAPSAVLLIGGTVVLTIRNAIPSLSLEFMLTLLVLITMSFHVLAFEQGKKSAALDFCITFGGILYLGLLGGYLVMLRDLPDGFWWLLVVLPAAWFADLGGYFLGRRFGKHPLAPRLSPKKTWEGYFGGILLGVLGTGLMGALWHMRVPQITFSSGFIIGGLLSLILPLGDLGESLFKRQFEIKDSSNIIPGHGGVLDRIDTWIWAAAIGYYIVRYIV